MRTLPFAIALSVLSPAIAGAADEPVLRYEDILKIDVHSHIFEDDEVDVVMMVMMMRMMMTMMMKIIIITILIIVISIITCGQ